MMLADISSKSTRQGCAYYNGVLFIFHDSNDVVEIYDVDEKKLMSTFNMVEKGLSHNEYHCNNVNFGKQKYDANDNFPLLYVSMEHFNQHKILVFRITGNLGYFDFDLVQTIVLPIPSQISQYYPNCYIDAEKNSMWISGYTNNNYQAFVGNRLKYIRYNLPDIKEGKIVELKTTDIQNVIEFNSITATQGGSFYKGKLYQVFGISSPYYLVVFNLEAPHNKQTCKLNISGDEPEGLFIKDGVVYFTTLYSLRRINF